MTDFATTSIAVRTFTGERRPFERPLELLLTARDGFGTVRFREYVTSPHTLLRSLPCFGNMGDRYTVLAWAKGYAQAGFTPVTVFAGKEARVDLMLVRRDASYNFQMTRWELLATSHPQIALLLQSAERTIELVEQHPASLACFLNIAESASQIALPAGTALEYLMQLPGAEWMQSDRFFAWADRRLAEDLARAAAAGRFAEEPAPGVFHKGATRSFKQTQFDEANLQISLHENDVQLIAGKECIKVELDIDYYKDTGAHALLEVIPNTFTGSRTDPRQIYVRRWMAARNTGAPEFAPPYALT